MEQLLRETLLASGTALLGIFLLPLALVRGPAEAAEPPQTPAADTALEQTEEAESPAAPHDRERTLRVLEGDTVREMTMEDYLFGVTAAEMPASFVEEALKAQAVAARTYTLYKLISGGNHGDTADICTDSTCCQAYIAPESARANWGENAESYTEKIRTAVAATDGEAILYGGVPILAVFHASSAGCGRTICPILNLWTPRRRRRAFPIIIAVWNFHRRI